MDDDTGLEGHGDSRRTGGVAGSKTATLATGRNLLVFLRTFPFPLLSRAGFRTWKDLEGEGLGDKSIWNIDDFAY